jgi:hypothetical protein
VDADTAFVLIHSPVTGPMVWSAVAAELRRRGRTAAVPELVDCGGLRPYWQDFAEAAAEALEAAEAPALLVAHSGAGLLLPAIARSGERRISGYLFVDAALPSPGRCQLDILPEQIQASLQAGRRFPDWSDGDLEEVVPDWGTRHRLLKSLRPRGLDFFAEELPVVSDWPDAPCAYLLLSEGYRESWAEARRLGWPTSTLAGGHFHMLVDPGAVADRLCQLARRIEA